MNVNDGGVCAYGAGVMIRHLQAMLVEVPGIRAGQDIEHIHRMRVASRRLRAALPLFAPCFARKKSDAWEKALRRVTRSLGAARDTDVQIEVLNRFLQDRAHTSEVVPGIRRLVLRWSQRRADLQEDVLKSLDEMQNSRVFEKMGVTLLPFTLGVAPDMPPTHALYQLADRAVGAALDEFLSFEAYIPQPEKAAELHQMRIAAKRLRYTLETFSALYPDGLSGAISSLRSAQDFLGEIHDCDVWQMVLPGFLEEEKQRVIAFYGTHGPWNLLLPGVKAFLENRAALREDKYQAFVRRWQTWQEKQTWANLRRAVSAPLIDSSVLYPPPAGSAPGEEEQT